MTTFKMLRPNFYQSSNGYSIEILGRTGLTYSEFGKMMFVDSEVLTGSTGMGVYKDSILHWNPPYENEVLSDSDKERILNNIKDIFRFQGFEIDVI